MLPSLYTLTALLALSSTLLVAPLVIVCGLPLFGAAAMLIAMPVASGIVTYAIKALDKDSIVSVRRMFGLALVSNLVWVVPLAAGSAVSWAQHESQSIQDELIVGAFLAWSLELLVVNGAFIQSTARSLALSAIRPLVTLSLAVIFVVRFDSPIIYSTALGLLILAIIIVFLLRFKAFKTKGIGVSSLQTFQSFLKTWVSQNPTDLERYFTMYSHEEPISTKMIVLQGTRNATLVLPGVHPGPFFPVGSYNISELIFHELSKSDLAPVVLHGVGGHERNLPTNELAKRYAAAIALAAKSRPTGLEARTMKGPNRYQTGSTVVTTIGFADTALAFLSNAPYNTDDLEPKAIDRALASADSLGVELMLVDAHNSIGGSNTEQPELDWYHILSDIRTAQETEFEVGFAHSSELDFHPGSDVSDGGVTVVVFRKQQTRYALISSDSNNAVVGLRQAAAEELKKEGVELIELCTSDTHNSAARSLTSRGYRALGEDTDWAELLSLINRLEKLAEGRLSRAEATAVASQMKLPLIGDRSLDDFATLTKDVLNFTKAYMSGALVAIGLVCLFSLFL